MSAIGASLYSGWILENTIWKKFRSLQCFASVCACGYGSLATVRCSSLVLGNANRQIEVMISVWLESEFLVRRKASLKELCPLPDPPLSRTDSPACFSPDSRTPSLSLQVQAWCRVDVCVRHSQSQSSRHFCKRSFLKFYSFIKFFKIFIQELFKLLQLLLSYYLCVNLLPSSYSSLGYQLQTKVGGYLLPFPTFPLQSLRCDFLETSFKQTHCEFSWMAVLRRRAKLENRLTKNAKRSKTFRLGELR